MEINKSYEVFKEMFKSHFYDMSEEQIGYLAEVASVHSELEFLEHQEKPNEIETESTIPIAIWSLRGVLKNFPDLKIVCNGDDLNQYNLKINCGEFFSQFPETVDLEMELIALLREEIIRTICDDLSRTEAKTLFTRKLINKFEINKSECKIMLSYNLL